MSVFLIRGAELPGVGVRDVEIRGGVIGNIDFALPIPDGAQVVEARGNCLLPGLNDHHIHMAATAAARQSLDCGSLGISSAQAFREKLRSANGEAGEWLRGIGYQESIAGDIDAAWLDAAVPDRPVRIQHRGGRLWVLNSAALALLQIKTGDPLERAGGKPTGRLYEGDAWLRRRMQDSGQGGFPDLSAVSCELASYGVTGVTDTTPHNDVATVQLFSEAIERGELQQQLRIMGGAGLNGVTHPRLQVGEHKFHLLESRLPDIDSVVADICCAHEAGRGAAFHCVTRVELAFALAALDEAGVLPGDRIEHASVAPPEMLEQISALGLAVVTQPSLIFRRGDSYLAEVSSDDQPWLYRCRAWLDGGVPLAFSSDSPYGDLNPWRSMQAAVLRRTADGAVMTDAERLTADQALACFTGRLSHPGSGSLAVQVGAEADLMLLDRNWTSARSDLSRVSVAKTWSGSALVWSNQAPASPSG